MEEWETDPEFIDTRIKAFNASSTHVAVTFEDGTVDVIKSRFFTQVEIEEGMPARVYGMLSSPRGLFINGQKVFYRNIGEEALWQKGEQYGHDCNDLLGRWDRGDAVTSIEMGGLSPAYEQAIQLLAFEMLRFLVETTPALAEMDEDQIKNLCNEQDKATDWAARKLGVSGAQHGAARNISFVFFRNGPVAAIEMMPDKNRHIRVSKNFPSL